MLLFIREAEGKYSLTVQTKDGLQQQGFMNKTCKENLTALRPDA